MEYSNAHRLLLTYIRSVRYVSQVELLKCFDKIIKYLEPNTTATDQVEAEEDIKLVEQLNGYIDVINSHIVDHGFKVDRRMDECTSQLYYIFINVIGHDDIAKTYTNYTVNELQSIKQLIDEIIDSPNFEFAIGKVNASQKIVANQNKTTRDAQAFIVSLVDNGWFIVNQNDRLLLSPRSLCELKDYLIDRYNIYTNDGKILMCNGCKQIVTLGYLLPQENSCYHYKCLEIFQRSNPQDYELVKVGVDISTLF